MKNAGTALAALAALLVLLPLTAAAQEAPATGASPAPVVLPAIFADDARPAPRKEPWQPHWGVGFRYGAAGVTDLLVDLQYDEHPSLSGSAYGVEIRYYGEKGSQSPSSVALTVDYFEFEVGDEESTWRDGDTVYRGGGDMKMTAVTFTAYHDFLAGFAIHPYAGFGIGYANADPSITLTSSSEVKTYKKSALFAVHIPVGVAMNIGKFATFRVEARYLDSLSWGGQLMVNF